MSRKNIRHQNMLIFIQQHHPSRLQTYISVMIIPWRAKPCETIFDLTLKCRRKTWTWVLWFQILTITLPWFYKLAESAAPSFLLSNKEYLIKIHRIILFTSSPLHRLKIFSIFISKSVFSGKFLYWIFSWSFVQHNTRKIL